MNPIVHYTTIENDDRRLSTFYIALKTDNITSGKNDSDANRPFINKAQLCSSMEKNEERSIGRISIDQTEYQDHIEDQAEKNTKMKRVVLSPNAYKLAVPGNVTTSTSHITTSTVEENAMSLPTNSFVSSKVPITLLPSVEMGTTRGMLSTLPSECTLHSSANAKKSISFIRRNSSIKLYRHNSLLNSITSNCAMNSVGIGQPDVPVKALDTKQLYKFLSDKTAHENIFRSLLSLDENEIEWTSALNADGSLKAVCLQRSAITQQARDKKLQSSSTLSNFFLKRSFRSIPLKRTNSVTKVYVSMRSTDDLRVSRSHENLLSNNVPSSSVDSTNGGTVSILPVHASLLGHRHGFQIYSASYGVKHYSCRSRQERDLWMHGLRKILFPNNINALRKDNSVKIWIYEAKLLSTKKRYFCEIYLDQALYGRTSSKLNIDLLFWGECLEFLDIPDSKIITIKVFREADKRKWRDKDLLIGTVHISILDTMPHIFCEEWYPILPEKKDGSSKSLSKQSQSTLRVKCRFQSLTILPINEYREFLTYLKKNYLKVCELIEPVIGVKAKEEIGQAMVLMMHSQNMAAPFLADVVGLDLLRIDDQRLTFRGNSLATKSMEAFLKLCGEQYLQDTLFVPIVKIIDSERDCEVDPMKTKGILLKQQQELRSAVEAIWKAILNSIHFFPFELRVCFSTFRERLKSLGREDISDNLISASLFLRFLCPAILSPNLFNITNEMPSARSTRNLTLVAKTLQTLANFTRFQGKEYFMEYLNSFIEQEAPRMKQFLFDISNLQLNPNNERTFDWSQHIDQGKHLAILHSLLLEALTKLSKDKRNELAPLETILESLSSLKQSEKILSLPEGFNEYEHSLVSTNKLSTANGLGQQTCDKVRQRLDNAMPHNEMKLTIHSSYDNLHYVHSLPEKKRTDNYQEQNLKMREREKEEKQTNSIINQGERASTLPRNMNCHWANLLKREEVEQENSFSRDTKDIIASDKQHVQMGLCLNDSMTRKFTPPALFSPLNIIQKKIDCSTFLKDMSSKLQRVVDHESNPSNMPMRLEDLQDLFNYADEQHVLKNNSTTENGRNNGLIIDENKTKHGACDKASLGNIPIKNEFPDSLSHRGISNELEINYQQLTRKVNNGRQISTFLSSDCAIIEPTFTAKNGDFLNVYTDSYRIDKSNEEPTNILKSDMFEEKRMERQFIPRAVGKCVDLHEISNSQNNEGDRNFKPTTHFVGSDAINDISIQVDNRLSFTYDAALAGIASISVPNIEPSDSRHKYEHAIYSSGNRGSDMMKNPMVQYKRDEYLKIQNDHPKNDKKDYVRHTSNVAERECISDTEYRYNSSIGALQYIQCSKQSNSWNNNNKAIEEHIISNQMRLSNFQSVEQCEREIKRLQAALDAMRQKIETSEFKHELQTDLTNSTFPSNTIVGGLIGRLLVMEEELRREQQTMYLALSQKQRVIEAQGQQIAALDAANNRLLTALSSMQKKYQTDSAQIGEDSISRSFTDSQTK
ncbi:ras GTPase-activating protein raskol [Anopheles darlingi]|uniref:ras GTPase-activating protein raskol n=1 Tax=Anopheles darlingi TaxID=43151 RepID=UPI0021000464|nr:ras GTPase-activating protein raskol [Anopheles darlingi]